MPFTAGDDFVEAIRIVILRIGPAEYADTDLDKRSAGLSFVKAERFSPGGEFLDGAGDGAARAGDDIAVFEDEVDDVRIGFVEPGSVIVVAVVGEGSDDAGPVETSAAIEAVFADRAKTATRAKRCSKSQLREALDSDRKKLYLKKKS